MTERNYQANFSTGRIGPLMLGRVDVAAYADGLAECANFIPDPRGPLRRRPGFLWQGTAKTGGKEARLVAFRRSETDQLQIEFGDTYCRFWLPDGSPVKLHGAIYEIVSPYREVDLDGLRFDQSNDVLYITHIGRRIRPRSLVRSGPTSWAFADLDFRNGPWRRRNTDKDFTLTATNWKGNVTLAASKDLFVPGHIGAKFRLLASDGSPGVTSWVPSRGQDPTKGGHVVLANELQLSDGKVYRATSTVNTDSPIGNTAPIHDQGIVSDGAVEWEYIHDGAGVVRITAVTDARNAVGTVERNLPVMGLKTVDLVHGDTSYVLAGDMALPATSYWQESRWSYLHGWPGDVCVAEDERIAFSGPFDEPGRYTCTTTDGFGPDWVDFTPGLGTGRVTDDDAIDRQIRGGRDPLSWLASTGWLMAGTTSQESLICGQQVDDPITPASTRSQKIADNGSADVDPVNASGGVVFVSGGGRTVRVVGFDLSQRLTDVDLSYFADDLMEDRIVELALVRRPQQILWARTATGRLLSLTYDPVQHAIGWAQHPLAMSVVSISSLIGEDGRDVLWIVGTFGFDRHICTLATPWRSGMDPSLRIYLDCCQLYDGPAANVLGGLGHLEGRAVRIFGDGGRLRANAVVTGGQVTLPIGETVTKAVVGLTYLSRAESLPLDIQGPAGSIGMEQQVKSVTVWLSEAVEARAGFADGAAEKVGGDKYGEEVQPGYIVDKVPVGGADSRRARIWIECEDGWPLNLLAWRAEADVND